MGLDGFLDHSIQALDHVDGVDDLADCRIEGDVRDHVMPYPPPDRGSRGAEILVMANQRHNTGLKAGVRKGRHNGIQKYFQVAITAIKMS